MCGCERALHTRARVGAGRVANAGAGAQSGGKAGGKMGTAGGKTGGQGGKKAGGINAGGKAVGTRGRQGMQYRRRQKWQGRPEQHSARRQARQDWWQEWSCRTGRRTGRQGRRQERSDGTGRRQDGPADGKGWSEDRRQQGRTVRRQRRADSRRKNGRPDRSEGREHRWPPVGGTIGKSTPKQSQTGGKMGKGGAGGMVNKASTPRVQAAAPKAAAPKAVATTSKAPTGNRTGGASRVSISAAARSPAVEWGRVDAQGRSRPLAGADILSSRRQVGNRSTTSSDWVIIHVKARNVPACHSLSRSGRQSSPGADGSGPRRRAAATDAAHGRLLALFLFAGLGIGLLVMPEATLPDPSRANATRRTAPISSRPARAVRCWTITSLPCRLR